MVDDHKPNHSAPESRPPWERHLFPSTAPDSNSSDTAPNRRGRSAKRSLADADTISVSQLVSKLQGGTEPTAATTTPPVRDFSPPAVKNHAQGEQHAAAPQVIAAPPLTRLQANRQRRRRRLHTAARSAIGLFAVLALLLTGTVWAYLRSADNAFAQVAALDENSTDVVDPVGQTGDETFLIVGTDTRAGKNSDVGAGTEADAEGARSDTVMLVTIPANRQRVVAVSFPRDLDVHRPSCQGWNSDTGEYTDETFAPADGDKLNATYALGGPKCLVKVIQKISGLRVGHFIGMDFSGFEGMVNEVGGVEVCYPTPLVDDVLGTVLPKAGRQRITGKTALNYVRARHVASEGNGDYGRIKRQQRFLSSLLRSALSSKVLFDPGKLNGFINAFTRDTFVEKVTTRDLMMLGRSLQNVDAGAVTFLTVPTAGTNEWGNEIPRPDDIDAIFAAIINDDPLPGEERKAEPKPTTAKPPTPATSAQKAVDPASVTVQVSNGSGVTGAAASTANALGSYGYQIYSVGNYPSSSNDTVIRYSAGHAPEAATVAASVPGAKLKEVSGLGSIVEVVIGADFTGTVKKPPASGSALTTATVPTPAASTATSAAPSAPALPSDLSVTNAADDSCE
ncbi:LytR family transcriptional regulator [Skermania sp. ID1734]|uniref:LCP family protein n=1 Tax=Skermania sp. ID1734 TaxID=2597516 RepID=UPI00117F1A4B|nr:LCP family protein [Skermania sp. ID1734]TSD96567.1 LytR family transcriptional regulator [Skermania sp. ID1734]